MSGWSEAAGRAGLLLFVTGLLLWLGLGVLWLQGRRQSGRPADPDAARLQQEAVRSSLERFQKIYQTTPDAMGISHIATGVYLDVNPSFLSMTGYAREQVVGHTAAEISLWAEPAQRVRLFEEFVEKGQVDSAEMTVRCKDGQLLSGLLSARHLVEEGKDCMLFNYRDITDRRRLQQDAERARSEVIAAAAASQAKTEFLSRMSHELRTPMNAVLGFAQLLRDAPLLVEAGPEHARERGRVDAILQAGWHLLTLIDDVLDIARIESGHMQLQLRPLALRQVLDEAIELLRPQAAAAGVELDSGAPEQWAHRLIGDPQRLRQALVNLLSNAVKYNRRGGHVRLYGELGHGASEGQFWLRIADTGRGMSAQQMAHLFEPFNRLGRERESIDGTGIGLVLTKYLLELMDASLALQSQPGMGTTVSLSLPLAPPDDEPPPASALRQALGPAPLAAASVLYIEDNLVNQLVVKEMLATWPSVGLVLASDGEQGLRRAAELRPDLILLDMRLPDMDGLQVLRRLKADAQLAGIKVVALSASAMPDDVALTLASGALEYWTKPLRLDQFLPDLRRVLAD